jgi:hypothetical protein
MSPVVSFGPRNGRDVRPVCAAAGRGVLAEFRN